MSVEGIEMSRQEFSLAYNGASRKSNHTIDVETLAPALLAFGKLLREANVEFNGKKSSTKVLVASDFEHKCFQINFELIVSIYEQINILLGSEPVQTAKEILDWIGLLTPAGAGSTVTLSYLGYLKWKNGRKIQYITDQDDSGVVTIKIEGENNTVNVNNRVYNLSKNSKALKATRDVFNPIGIDDFDRLELKDKNKVLDVIDIQESEKILASCNIGLNELDEVEPEVEVSSAWLNVYSPVYDAEQSKWRFNLGREHIYVDISETSIVEDALERGGALIEDSYQVSLEITTPIGKDGKKGKPVYKALKVLKFIPADPSFRQIEMPIDPKKE